MKKNKIALKQSLEQMKTSLRDSDIRMIKAFWEENKALEMLPSLPLLRY